MSTGAPPGGDLPAGAQLNIAHGQATQNIVQHGNLYVGGPPNYRIDEVHPSRPDVSRTALRAPSRLLAARYQVVDFTGRERELAELASWRDDPQLGLAVRLVHGSGGQGKTRLAARFAQHCAEQGWTVAQAVHRSYDTAPTTAALDTGRPADSAGLVLIVDYAERWPLSDLLALAQDPLLRAGVPTRVLLLSRPAGLWWDDLSYRLADRFEMATDQRELTALADTVAARTAVFTAARDRFATLLDVPDPGQIPAPERLGEDAFGLVLTVHMAALAAVDAHARSESPPSDPAALSAYLLQRERAHWQAMYDNDQRVHTTPQMMARAVFTATLTRPQPYPDGVAALRRAGIPDPEQVLDDHLLCYPPNDPATVCEPLYPDRLGEDFLALSIPGHNLTALQPDPWADTAVSRLLTNTNDAGAQHGPAYAPQAVTVLFETARRWPHIAQCHLFPLLRTQPGLALAAGGTGLAWLADLPGVDMSVLEAIETLLPSGRHIDLDIAVAAVTSRLTRHRLAATTDPTEHARLYANLSVRLAHAGRWDDALAATSEAVQIHRRLAQANPTVFDPQLARSLNNLGNRLAILGRPNDAVSATTEAVQIHRQLAQTNPTAHEPDLAGSLSNLAPMLLNLDRGDDALAVATEAVQIHRRLAQANPTEHTPGLAGALTNLGMTLSKLGRPDDALSAAIEVFQLYLRMAHANPATYAPDLAKSLANLGSTLSNLSRHDEALTATIDAVQFYRQLAQTNPTAHEADLAGSLFNLGMLLSNLGRRSEAVTATTDAVQIYRRLVQTNPTTHEPNLAGSLANLGLDLTILGRPDEALAATTDAVQIYRQLAQTKPSTYEPDLARTLTNLGLDLKNLGRRDEAVTATTDAVQIYRRLAQTNPTTHEPNLAVSLNSLGLDLADLGRHDEALTAATEAVQIRRRLVHTNPTAYEPNLATSLINLGPRLSILGRHDEALTAVTDAVQICRRLVQTNPTTHEPDLARTLTNLGVDLANLGRRDEALTAITDAVQIYRRLVQTNPTTHEPGLARGLWVFAQVRVANQVELPEAAKAAQESVASYERLTEQLPLAFSNDLHDALATLAEVLDRLGRDEEADRVRERIDQLGGQG
ncbi:MAG: tetratricopeptide repeat protein [Pseudonocardiaceae bacterium]